MNWFLLAILAAICFTAMNLLFKKILDLGVKTETLVLYIFGIVTIMSLAYSVYRKDPLNVSKIVLLFLILAALASYIGNLLLVKALKAAPNPGYALAINSLQILLVAVASFFLFKSELTLLKGLGAFLVVIGVILLGL